MHRIDNYAKAKGPRWGVLDRITNVMNREDTKLWRFVRFPMTRIFIGLSWVLLAIVVGQLGTMMFPKDFQPFIGMTAVPGIAITAYGIFTRLIEKRQPTEIVGKDSVPKLLLGVFMGGTLMVMVVISIAATGGYHVAGTDSPIGAVKILCTMVGVAVIEELLVRAVIFRILQEWLGTISAVVISGVLFGAMHLANPHATLWMGIAIALEAGVLLAAAYVWSKGLWLSIGLHFGWNFFQSGIFGLNTSGNSMHGLLKATTSGAELISGGTAGPEGSIFAVIFCFGAGIAMLISAQHQGLFVGPMWKSKGLDAVQS